MRAEQDFCSLFAREKTKGDKVWQLAAADVGTGLVPIHDAQCGRWTHIRHSHPINYLIVEDWTVICIRSRSVMDTRKCLYMKRKEPVEKQVV